VVTLDIAVNSLALPASVYMWLTPLLGYPTSIKTLSNLYFNEHFIN